MKSARWQLRTTFYFYIESVPCPPVPLPHSFLPSQMLPQIVGRRKVLLREDFPLNVTDVWTDIGHHQHKEVEGARIALWAPRSSLSSGSLGSHRPWVASGTTLATAKLAPSFLSFHDPVWFRLYFTIEGCGTFWRVNGQILGNAFIQVTLKFLAQACLSFDLLSHEPSNVQMFAPGKMYTTCC